MSKLDIEKLTRLTKQVFFGECLNYFCPCRLGVSSNCRWAEHYRPVRHRTVRSETTKEKADALPPAVFEKAKTGKWSELSFPDSCAKSSIQPLQFLMNKYSCVRHLTVRLSLLSVTRKFPKSSSPLSLDLSKWMNFSDSESDYDERESEEIAEHSNAITRSGRRIKASARHQLVEQALNTFSGNGRDVITLKIHIVVIVEDQ